MSEFDISTACLLEDIVRLCSLCSVSGYEYRAEEQIREIYGEHFDEIQSDGVGNYVLIKYSGRANAPRIMVDAHFDEVGFIVREILEGGFLRIAPVGGIDSAIMQASDVVVYGREELFGVVASIPPHLRNGKGEELPEPSDLIVDMGGYSKEELCALCPIGTPVGYAPVYREIGEGYLSGKSFDNKACGAIAARAVINTPKKSLAGDVYLCFSAREETAHGGGVKNVTFRYNPDYAMVVDVNFGNAPDVPKRESVGMKKGISVCYSAATDRELTRQTAELCRAKDIDYTPCAAPSSTGTNATVLNLVGEGVPVVDIGLPLRNMHTYSELLALEDARTLCSCVAAFICSSELATAFAREGGNDR